MRVSFSSGLPSLLLSISYEYTLLFCIYLATMPKKREALGFIGQYLFIAAIKMVYGSRCDFILGLMFVLVYFVIRDRINEKYNLAETQWFGKREKTITLVSIPVLIIHVKLPAKKPEITSSPAHSGEFVYATYFFNFRDNTYAKIILTRSGIINGITHQPKTAASPTAPFALL